MRLDARNKGDGLVLLRAMRAATTKLVFFDPQYRAGLDKLKFGNEGKRQKRRADLPQMSTELIKHFGMEIERVLTPSGYAMVWMDKFNLCNFRVGEVFRWHSEMQIVDLITWRTGRFGMGKRSRRTCEYLMILQKRPVVAAATWSDHGIRDVWDEKVRNVDHVHRKPMELQKRLIGAVTKPGDIIVDPCAGSFSVLEAARAMGRHCMACDLNGAPPKGENHGKTSNSRRPQRRGKRVVGRAQPRHRAHQAGAAAKPARRAA